MVRKTKREAEATREAILEAASKIFVNKGVGKASLEEIAHHAGVTRGAVYWHFKNKLDIFKALYDQLYTPFTETILKGLQEDHPQPLEQLASICTQLFLEFSSNTKKRRNLSIFFLKCDYSGEMEEIRRCQNERKAKSLPMFQEYFKRAQAMGHLSTEADPHVLALSLVSYITGLVYEFLRNPEVFELGRYAPQLVENMFKGITAN